MGQLLVLKKLLENMHSQTYLALLRGINVGGKSMIKMADLRDALTASGLKDVQSYIQSGNVIFTAPKATDERRLEKQIHDCIKQQFKLEVAVVVLSKQAWSDIISNAPAWWGVDGDWKHNLLVAIQPATAAQVVEAIGVLKPDIERVEAGKGAVYQSILFEKFGRTSSGKLASLPIYKNLTIRNYNTAQKLQTLLNQIDSITS